MFLILKMFVTSYLIVDDSIKQSNILDFVFIIIFIIIIKMNNRYDNNILIDFKSVELFQ